MASARSLRQIDKRYIAGLFLLLQGLDILTTFVGLRNGAVEANPFAAWVMSSYGEFVMYGLKAALVLAVLAVVLLTERVAPRVWLAMRTVNVIMLVVVMINLMVFL